VREGDFARPTAPACRTQPTSPEPLNVPLLSLGWVVGPCNRGTARRARGRHATLVGAAPCTVDGEAGGRNPAKGETTGSVKMACEPCHAVEKAS